MIRTKRALRPQGAIRGRYGVSDASATPATITDPMNSRALTQMLAIGIGGVHNASDDSRSHPTTLASLNSYNWASKKALGGLVPLTTFKTGGSAVKLDSSCNEANFPNGFYIRQILVYSDGVSTVYLPLTFGGQNWKLVNAGEDWETDNVAIVDRNGAAWTLPTTTARYIVTEVKFDNTTGTTTGQIVHRYKLSTDFNEYCYYNVSNLDAIATGTAPSGTNCPYGAFGPDWWSGASTESCDSYLILGDSISVNSNYNALNYAYATGHGHIGERCATVGFQNWSIHTSQIVNRYNERSTAYSLNRLAKHFTHVVLCFGANDFAANIANQDWLTRHAGVIAAINAASPATKVLQIILPRTSGTYATEAGQTPAGTSATVIAYTRSASWIADLAAAGATLKALCDISATPPTMGVGAAAHACRIEYYSSGWTYKWDVDEAATSLYNGTVTATSATIKQDFVDSGLITGNLAVEDENKWQVLGKRLVWLTGANAGQSKDIDYFFRSDSANKIRLASACTNNIAVGDTYKIINTFTSDGVHMTHAQHQIVAQWFKENLAALSAL